MRGRRILQILREFLGAEFIEIRIVPGPDLQVLLGALRSSRTSLEEKVQKAHESLQETAQLVDELEGNLKQKMDRLSSLQKQYQEYSRIAEIEEKKAKAILEQIEKTLTRGKGRDRWERLLISLVSGLIVFLLGIFLGPIIKALFGIG